MRWGDMALLRASPGWLGLLHRRGRLPLSERLQLLGGASRHSLHALGKSITSDGFGQAGSLSETLPCRGICADLFVFSGAALAYAVRRLVASIHHFI